MAPFGIVGIKTPRFLCRILGHRYRFAGMGVIAPDAETANKAEQELDPTRHCERCGCIEPRSPG